jgi:anti-sigma regulatory factor (Ser/Thr protein kinase)
LSAIDLIVRPEAIAEARRYIRRTLSGHPRAEDAVLATSELVTNVVRHSPRSRSLRLVMEQPSPEVIRVSVRQPAGEIATSPPRTHRGGRGLKIVEAVTDRWGIEREGWIGAWFEIGT